MSQSAHISYLTSEYVVLSWNILLPYAKICFPFLGAEILQQYGYTHDATCVTMVFAWKCLIAERYFQDVICLIVMWLYPHARNSRVNAWLHHLFIVPVAELWRPRWNIVFWAVIMVQSFWSWVLIPFESMECSSFFCGRWCRIATWDTGFKSQLGLWAPSALINIEERDQWILEQKGAGNFDILSSLWMLFALTCHGLLLLVLRHLVSTEYYI